MHSLAYILCRIKSTHFEAKKKKQENVVGVANNIIGVFNQGLRWSNGKCMCVLAAFCVFVRKGVCAKVRVCACMCACECGHTFTSDEEMDEDSSQVLPKS